ncbi:hypothetical protein DBV15_08295 [Temnothorax longispinosus]|uniref:Uncharacterized protein n=1 Tax=Temnothorax longispinosus TaxID=300112 RepID=A0A4S2KHB6_9HYME|nr:hypothetical protein DBV15_08295 [Temnothorax longispinosus]
MTRPTSGHNIGQAAIRSLGVNVANVDFMSNIPWRECADRGTRSTGTRHGGAILVTEAAVTVVVVDIDLVSVDLSFFVSLAYGPCRVRENDTRRVHYFGKFRGNVAANSLAFTATKIIRGTKISEVRSVTSDTGEELNS